MFFVSDADKDSFWDLDVLLPARKKSQPAKPFAARVETVEISAPPKQAPVNKGETRITAALEEKENVTAYHPQGNDLLLSVRVAKRVAEYNFYGQFCRDAAKYLREEGDACAFVPFFSYIPQYSQLNDAQKQYYFYWRSAVRRGEYPQTEESYFYLYVYEIINLPEIIPPENGIELLCDVWTAYRKSLPRINKYMVEWVADYCLVHALPCPSEKLRPFLAKILPLATLKEFYLGAMGDYSPRGVDTALAFFSDYRWRESRYAAGEGYPLFETHILAALSPVLEYLFARENTLLREAARTIHRRDAFCGSLCAHNVRCRLEITYHSVRDASDLRSCITAAVKYAENKLRALLMVKSRLSVHISQLAVTDLIDRYFAGAAHSIKKTDKAESLPEYEKWYDAPTQGVDFAHAQEIEKLSWGTTMTLIPEEEAKEIEEKQKAPEKLPDVTIPPESADEAALTDDEKTYLRLRMDAVDDVQSFLRACGKMEDEIVAAINEKSLLCIGDVILESDGLGYCIVEDYMEEISAWIG